MTFRPSDDVLDEVSTSQPIIPTNENDSLSQSEWWHMFQQPNDWDNQWVFLNQEISPTIPDIQWEEVKAPDLSELLNPTIKFEYFVKEKLFIWRLSSKSISSVCAKNIPFKL